MTDDEKKTLPVQNRMEYIRINSDLLDKIEGRQIGPCFVRLDRVENDDFVEMTIIEEDAKSPDDPNTMQEALTENKDAGSGI